MQYNSVCIGGENIREQLMCGSNGNYISEILSWGRVTLIDRKMANSDST